MSQVVENSINRRRSVALRVNSIIQIFFVLLFLGTVRSAERVLMIENFEQIKDYYSFSGNEAQITFVETNCPGGEGNRSLKITWFVTGSNPEENYSGIGESFGDISLTNGNVISLWVKGDGQKACFKLNLEDKNRQRWEYVNDSILLGTRWQKLEIPIHLVPLNQQIDGRTGFDWSHISSINFVVTPASSGSVKLPPRQGVIYIDKVELLKENGRPKKNVFSYIPSGYLLTEFYSDPELKRIAGNQKNNSYGIYTSLNIEPDFFLGNWELHGKFALPSKLVISGVKPYRGTDILRGDDMRILYPNDDSLPTDFSIMLKQLYIQYKPQNTYHIEKLRFGTQFINWSPYTLLGVNHYLGFSGTGKYLENFRINTLLLGDPWTQRYFGGIRFQPGSDPGVIFHATGVTGLQYLRIMDDNTGEPGDRRRISEEYSLLCADIQYSREEFYFLKKLVLFSALADFNESKYGEVGQQPGSKSKELFFSREYVNELGTGASQKYQALLCILRTSLEFHAWKPMSLEAEGRLIGKGFGGAGYKDSMLQWMRDGQPKFMNMEYKMEEKSFLEKKYSRLTRSTYDDQQGVRVDFGIKLAQRTSLSYSADFSETITSPAITEMRHEAGYEQQIRRILWMNWLGYGQAVNYFHQTVYDKAYFETGIRTLILTGTEAGIGFRVERDNLPPDQTASSLYTENLFFECISQIIPNVSVRLRVKQSFPQNLYNDIVGMSSYNRKGDSREYYDSMPDDYVQLLLRIDF